MSVVFQEVMRGPSEWSIGERELFAAWVSKKKTSASFERRPTARSRRRSSVMRRSRRRCGPIPDLRVELPEEGPPRAGVAAHQRRRRTTPRFHPPPISVRCSTLGVSRDGVIPEALMIGFAFNVITRMADAFEFEVGPPRLVRGWSGAPAQPRLQVILSTPARTERGRAPARERPAGPFAVKERP